MLLKNVHYLDVNDLLNQATKESIDFECFEGNLLDNYIIFADHNMEIIGNTFTYIIITETPLSVWESSYDILLTNDTNTMYNYLEYFENNNVYQAN